VSQKKHWTHARLGYITRVYFTRDASTSVGLVSVPTGADECYSQELPSSEQIWNGASAARLCSSRYCWAFLSVHPSVFLSVTRRYYFKTTELIFALSTLDHVIHFYRAMHYSAKRGLAIACRLSVRPSVTLVDNDHIDWKSWELTLRTISPTSSLFVAQMSSTYSQGNMEKFGGENVHSTPTSITSGWTESTESHVILRGGVAVCLLLSAHRAVISAIAQLSC